MTRFCYDSVVRGYHVYEDVWEASHGELLNCERETGNTFDPFAACVKKHDDIVGHVPRKISAIYSLFLQRGGRIQCEVTGTMQTIFNRALNITASCSKIGRESFLGGLIFVEKGIRRKPQKFVHLENFYAYGMAFWPPLSHKKCN